MKSLSGLTALLPCFQEDEQTVRLFEKCNLFLAHHGSFELKKVDQGGEQCTDGEAVSAM